MILTHLVMFSFLAGAGSAAPVVVITPGVIRITNESLGVFHIADDSIRGFTLTGESLKGSL